MKGDLISLRLGKEELKKLEMIGRLGRGEKSEFIRRAVREKLDRDWEEITNRLKSLGKWEKLLSGG